jgi:hypothetical protein
MADYTINSTTEVTEEFEVTGSFGSNFQSLIDEDAQDAVGNILSSEFTYDDVTPEISISSNSIKVDELDLSISPTWTGSHTFNAGTTMDSTLNFSSNSSIQASGTDHLSFDGAGNVSVNGRVSIPSGDQIRLKDVNQYIKHDSGDDYVEIGSYTGIRMYGANTLQPVATFDDDGTVSILNGNLDITEGNALRDDTGADRVPVNASGTRLNDETGVASFLARNGDGNKIVARSGTPAIIRDQEQLDAGVQYDTDASAGVLRTPNAGIQVQKQGIPADGVGLEVQYDTNNSIGVLRGYDRTNSNYKDVAIRGSTVEINGTGGLVDLSQSNANLRLSEGHAIEDENGDNRFGIFAGGGTETAVYDADNTIRINITNDDVELQNASGNKLLKASNNGPFDLSAVGQDLRLATGQAIEDGSGTERLTLFGTATQHYDDSGRTYLVSENAVHTQVRTYSNQPFKIQDQEQGATGVQYDTDASAGVLRTPNAGARIESTGTPSSGEGLELTYSTTGPKGVIRSFDRDTSVRNELLLDGGPITISSHSGLIDMSQQSADLRLATGQAIEDGSGNPRLFLESGRTRIHDGDTGTVSASLKGTPGTDVDITSNYVSVNNQDLRLATGQAIEDGSGTNRLTITSSGTFIKTESGRVGVSAREQKNAVRLTAYSGNDVEIYDDEQDATSVNYTTGASTGKLELTSAMLEANALGTFSGQNRTAIAVTGATTEFSKKIVFQDTNSSDAYLQSDNGELKATDDNGNTTTLT